MNAMNACLSFEGLTLEINFAQPTFKLMSLKTKWEVECINAGEGGPAFGAMPAWRGHIEYIWDSVSSNHVSAFDCYRAECPRTCVFCILRHHQTVCPLFPVTVFSSRVHCIQTPTHRSCLSSVDMQARIARDIRLTVSAVLSTCE